MIFVMLQERYPCGSELTSWGAASTEAGPKHRAAEKVKDLGDIFDIFKYEA
jgi:hypothetical protein